MNVQIKIIRHFGYKGFKGLLLAIISLNTFAAEVAVQSSISAAAEHDDNTRLSVNSPESLFGVTVSPRAIAEINTETLESQIDLKLDFSEHNRDGYDSDDQALKISSQKSLEKQNFGVRASAVRNSTRSSEDIDSGRFENSRREDYLVAPNWQYRFSEKQYLNLSGQYGVTDYESPRYTGYDNWSAAAQWNYRYKESLALFGRYNLSNYESDGRTQIFNFIREVDLGGGPILEPIPVQQTYTTKSDSDGFQLGANYQPFEQFTLNGLFGRSNSDTTYSVTDDLDACAVTEDDPSYISRGGCDLESQDSRTISIDASATWREERSELSLNYSNSNRPSSDGFLVESQRLTLNWQRRMAQNNTLKLEALWLENSTLDVPDGQINARTTDRTYYAFSLQYSHRLAEEFFLSTKYRYRQQERESINGTAESNSLTLSLTYRPIKKLFTP